jgi:hypothetical protein
LFSLLIVVLLVSSSRGGVPELAGQSPVRVIFDTDMDTDVDDIGALGILHALADLGEAEILAVTISGQEQYAAPCVDAINTYYGRPDIPIGVARGHGPRFNSRYNKPVADRCRHDLRSSADAPDAIEVYRKVLAAQPDNSVTIVTVGFMTNLAKLIETPADTNALSGMELVRQKIKLWVCMGGNFVGTPARDTLELHNHNFVKDSPSAYRAITAWPRPLVFVGREIGSIPSGLAAGARLKEAPADHPVRIGYEAYSRGEARDRHVADLTTVLYAVRGLRDYWDAQSTGAMEINHDMTFVWNPEKNRQQAYLLKRVDSTGQANDRYVEEEINRLLLQPRKNRPLPQGHAHR